MNACDCGATTEGKWASIHEKGCASLKAEMVLCPACQNWNDDCRFCDGTGEVPLRKMREHGAQP
jgi:hypothetical protein